MQVHYFKNLPLSIERDIWIKENRPTAMTEGGRKFSEWFTGLFKEKLDKPSEPTKCGMLQGKDLWLQGMITLETVYVEYRADVHVFDHLVHERFHYQVLYLFSINQICLDLVDSIRPLLFS